MPKRTESSTRAPSKGKPQATRQEMTESPPPRRQAPPEPDSAEPRIDALLRQLTLGEKVALLSGTDAWHTAGIDRLGIPPLTMTDGPHGVRATHVYEGRLSGPTTAFPTGISLASTWNPNLIAQVGIALGEEARAMGCDVLLGPCVNIMRAPLAGRNFESYSEDPYLAGRIGVAWVQGVQSRGVAASLKHYACNNQEMERFRGDSIVDQRTLHEIYLPAFERVVKEASPWTVMCAYNRVNGIYASQHRQLLTEILKEQWGFDGVVVSDWGANHTTVESIASGLDLEMPGPVKYYGRLLVEAVHLWQIDPRAVDEAARRILRLVMRCGKLDPADRLPSGAVNTAEHQELARTVAEEAITLLKNEAGLLPLDPNAVRSIAVLGPNAAEARLGGGGSAYVDPPYRISPLEGLRASLGDRVEIRYERGCDDGVQPPVLPSELLVPASGTGHGLQAEYFASPDLSGPADLETVEPQVDFRWFNHRPGGYLTQERFSARWRATLTAPGTGLHRLTLIHTDQCRLYLDGELLIDHESPEPFHPRDLGASSASATLEWRDGQSHDLCIEYRKTTDQWFVMVRLCLAPVPPDEETDSLTRAAELARTSDVAIVFAGLPERYETEGQDRPDWQLPGSQDELIRAVAEVKRRTIVVLNCGAPVAMPWIDQVPAVVLAYYPGQEGGHALARILSGEINPSGKLPVTFPRRMEDNPTFLHYPGGRQVQYGEGLFVGYRFYDACDLDPLFPFGHGLSYTTFEYSQLQVPARVATGETFQVSVVVKNSGPVAGREVVQLYVHDRKATLPRPPKELKGFLKVFLQPGESQKVSFQLHPRALSFYDPAQGCWVAEAGEFGILIGRSSRDIRAQGSFALG